MRSIGKIIGFLMALMIIVLTLVVYINQSIEKTVKDHLRVGTTYMTMNNPFYEVINAERKRNH